MKTPESAADSTLPLAQLRKGESAVVSGLVEVADLAGEGTGNVLLARLRDLGFTPGMRCEVIARMVGGDPLVVRIGGSTFALRRAEAAAVRVTPMVAQAAPRSSLAAGAATA